MINPLFDWTWEIRAAGILLRPRREHPGSEIWYVERLRPVDHVTALVARAPRLPRWHEDHRSPIERFVTDEGEYGAQVTLHGSLAGTPAVRTFAFVFGDDFVARLIGLARHAEEAPFVVEAVRHLARMDTHVLGIRRRRFVYQPPAGSWHGYLLAPFHAYFLPLEHPRDPSLITVFPAIPGSTDHVLDVHLASIPEVDRDDLRPGTEVVAADGLSGTWQTIVVNERTLDLAILGDDRFAYSVTFGSAPSHRRQHLLTFSSLVRSIEPIPRPPATRRPAGPTSLAHWTE